MGLVVMGYVVRYGRMRFLSECSAPASLSLVRGQRVVIRSDRGTELGEVLCPATEKTSSYLEGPATGEILRSATGEDLERQASHTLAQEGAFATCQELIARRRLQMKLIDVEIILGR